MRRPLPGLRSAFDLIPMATLRLAVRSSLACSARAQLMVWLRDLCRRVRHHLSPLRLLRVVALLSLPILLAACGGGGSKADAPTQVAATAGDTVVTLTWNAE